MAFPFRPIAVLWLASLLTACSAGAQPQAIGNTEPQVSIPVEINLTYRPDVQFAPFYVAIEKGYFANAGFDVTLTHRTESDIFREVALNTPDQTPLKVGVVSGDQVLLARQQELPVVFIYQWYQSFPVAIAARQEAGISSPEQLAGRAVGVPLREGASYIGLLALLDSAGLTEADIDLQTTGFTQVETLLSNRVDAVVVYSTNEPILLAEQGVPVSILMISDYTNLVSNGLIVNEGRLSAQEASLSALLAAYSEAVIYTIANPDEAFAISAGYVEGLDDPAVGPIAQQVLQASIPLWVSERLGESNPAAWENTQAVLLSAGILTAEQDLDAAFTNDLVPPSPSP